MQLKSFSIRRKEAWENGPDKFRGELVTTSAKSEVKVLLTDEQCRQILLIATPSVTQAADATAAFLRSEAHGLELSETQELPE